MNALNVLCAQLTRDLFAIAKFLLCFMFVISLPRVQTTAFRASPHFFTKRLRSAVIAFLVGSNQISSRLPPNHPKKIPFWGTF